MNLQQSDALSARETDHRVANCLQFLTVMLRHESAEIVSAEDAREVLAKAASRLAAMARVHRQLTSNALDDVVDLAAFLQPFCEDVADALAVPVNVEAAAVKLPAGMACEIGIILNEFATNSVKHARGGDGSAAVQVTATHEDGQLRIAFSDDGAGLPEQFSLDGSEGLGTMIMISSAGKIGGTIRVVPAQGARLEIVAPLP